MDGVINMVVYMNVVVGVIGGLSFFYFMFVDVFVVIKVYFGLNGIGMLFGIVNLSVNLVDYLFWN